MLLNRSVQLFHQLFTGLFYRVAAGFHLLGIVFLQQCILGYLILDEAHRRLPVDFHRGFPVLLVVEPGFRPPAESRPVGIDGDNSGDVEAAHVNLQSFQRVGDTDGGYRFVKSFFLPFSLNVERNTPWRKAK